MAEPFKIIPNNWVSDTYEGVGTLFSGVPWGGYPAFATVDGFTDSFFFTHDTDSVSVWGVVLDTPSKLNYLKWFTPTAANAVRWGFILQGTNEIKNDASEYLDLSDEYFDDLLVIAEDYSEWVVNGFTVFTIPNNSNYKAYRIKRPIHQVSGETAIFEIELWDDGTVAVINLPKIYIGNNLYLNSNSIVEAVGSELNSAISFQNIIDNIIYDKQQLVDILTSKDVVCDMSYSLNSLVELVNSIT